MNRDYFQEIRLRDFRCFHEEQRARMAPLTLLVGDNSTGKTSFLAAVRAVWAVAIQKTEPDFREPPYDLGAFPEIVHYRSDGENRASSFDIGFRAHAARRSPIEFNVTFTSHAASPSPSRLFWRTKDIQVQCSGVDTPEAIIDLASGNETWRFEVNTNLGFKRWWTPARFLSYWVGETIEELDSSSERLQKLKGTRRKPTRGDFENLSHLLHSFTFFPLDEPPFASAPIRSRPSRTYDPTRPSPDPEGAYVPTYFASVHFQDKSGWRQLKEKLEHFGR